MSRSVIVYAIGWTSVFVPYILSNLNQRLHLYDGECRDFVLSPDRGADAGCPIVWRIFQLACENRAMVEWGIRKELFRGAYYMYEVWKCECEPRKRIKYVIRIEEVGLALLAHLYFHIITKKLCIFHVRINNLSNYSTRSLINLVYCFRWNVYKRFLVLCPRIRKRLECGRSNSSRLRHVTCAIFPTIFNWKKRRENIGMAGQNKRNETGEFVGGGGDLTINEKFASLGKPWRDRRKLFIFYKPWSRSRRSREAALSCHISQGHSWRQSRGS